MNEICAVRPNHLTEGEVEDEKKIRQIQFQFGQYSPGNI